MGGKTLTAEFNDLAENADGSVLVKYGNSAVLATVVMDKNPGSAPFFPLTVDYEEKFYAAGQILGSRFMRREGKPSDEAVLSARIVDRTIRPLFDQRMRNSIQVVLTVLSIDEDDPDVLSVIATSLALSVSDIPWDGPVSAVRVGKVKESDELLVNPTYKSRQNGGMILDSLVCGKDGLINMIEIGSYEVSEDDATASLEKAQEVIKKVQDFQEEIIKERGKEKRVFECEVLPESLKDIFKKEIEPQMSDYVLGDAKARTAELEELWLAKVEETDPEANGALAREFFDKEVDRFVHKIALEEDKRTDGRKMDEVRPLFAQAGGISSILHGSGVFYRGGTHVLSALTLGGPGDTQIIDEIESQKEKHFMHHYNFPPFSVGETGRVGGFNRRQIGHGALAEKAIVPVLPPQDTFPYTIRIVSEVLSSNGSSSMASVCGSTLALMDAGVPVTRPVAGIAMGAMSESQENYKILTDIQGPEDHHGDMDLKVAGTREGITAVQMDVKVKGFPISALAEAFEKAKIARLQILDVIEKEIAEPRPEINPNAPHIITLEIKPEQIGLVIGSGGKTVNGIKEKTQVEIDIEDSGRVFITGEKTGAEEAKRQIEALTKEYEPGEKVEGEVIKIVDFGAFVKLDEFNEGLLHISEIAPFRVEKVEEVLKVGQKVPIVVKEINDRGQLRLSLKDADPNFVPNPNK